MVKNIFATKIKMNEKCNNSNELIDIDSIYLEGCQPEKFYKKEDLYDYLKYNSNPISILVKLGNYPALIPEISGKGEKYVKSTPNNTTKDNLLSLPRE